MNIPVGTLVDYTNVSPDTLKNEWIIGTARVLEIANNTYLLERDIYAPIRMYKHAVRVCRVSPAVDELVLI